ncbi:7 transmembrane receptor (rhodopsin family) [Nesidiocoris tenuis]|uniref:7 transmembrane receptor (Rhodopsin family) n=1 Tax=Nesidiocoris tenuis TaxID=355587 RepID=A0ABN7BCR2_9HEMI|nr:7 transmembrane receptor (rhodopsin family) [Nesidiocoris tenuis]
MRCTRGIIVALPLSTALAILSCIIFVLSRGDCPEGNFTCQSSRTCILQRSMCDGQVDCPKGEDEEPMYCRDLHGSFWEMIDHVSSRTPNETCFVSGSPEECKCSETTLVCTNSTLVEIPTPLPAEVTRLALDQNWITEIPTNAFENVSLRFIHLGFNDLRMISDGVFSNQILLQKIFLMGNRLVLLPKSLLKLPSLKWLFAYENHLGHLQLDEWEMESLTWLDLSKNWVTLENEVFPVLPKLRILYLDNNKIARIESDTFSSLSMLIDLSIAWNEISYIHELAFRNLTHLKDLNLKNNLLLTLDGQLFNNLDRLEKLTLGGNMNLRVTPDTLVPLARLKSLDLEDVEIPDINPGFFATLKQLDFVYFKRFKYCMNVPRVPKCLPLSDGTSTSENLLGNSLQRGTLWIVGIFTLTTNGLVVWRRVAASPNTISPLNIIITNLACADLLMGVYLVAVGWQDWMTRGVFRQMAAEWTSSGVCTVLGVLAMVSSEVSVLILLLISVERFMLISAPLSGFQSLKPKAAVMTSSAVWIFSLLIALLPVVEWRHSMRFYGANTFCFPLHIDEPYLVGWQYSAFVFIGINSVSLIGIALLYMGMFVSILKTRNATTLNVNDSEFAMRFFFIVLTNACCWIPIVLLKILAFLNVNISKEVYGWLGVFVLPVNSAINPILYTFTTPRYRNNNNEAPAGSQSHPDGHALKELPKTAIWSRALRLVQTKPPPRTVPTPRTTEEQI